MFLGLIFGRFREFQLFFGLQSGNVSVKLQHFGHVDLMAAVQQLELCHLLVAASDAGKSNASATKSSARCGMLMTLSYRLVGEIWAYMSRDVRLRTVHDFIACWVLAQPLGY